MNVDQKHNFFSVRCDVIDHMSIYRSSCASRIMKLRSGDQYADSMFPECARALKTGRCAVQKMIAEEFGKGPKYYLDRDDAGPGIASRSDLGLPVRTEDERKFHHSIAEKLGLIINEAKTANIIVRNITPTNDPVVPHETQPQKAKVSAFSLDAGTHITAAVQEMKNA